MQRVQLFRRSQIYWVRFTLDGKQRRQSLGTDNRKIAEDHRAQLEAKLRARELKLPRDIPLRPFLDRYLAYQKARKTKHGYEVDKCYVERFFAAVPVKRLNDLTPPMIIDYLVSRANEGRKPKTLNRIRECLRTMSAWAIDQGFVFENPLDRVKRFPEPKQPIRFLDMDEIEELLALFEGHRLHPLVTTFIFAGLRRSEAVWLGRDDVDLSRRLIRVRPQTDGQESWRPKTNESRVVPISSRLLPVLTGVQSAVNNGLTWVFPSPQGKRWDPDNLTHAFTRIVRGAGLPWRIADLRHTFGSHLAMGGRSLYQISKLMGNSPDVCRMHYAALVPEQMHDVVEF